MLINVVELFNFLVFYPTTTPVLCRQIVKSTHWWYLLFFAWNLSLLSSFLHWVNRVVLNGGQKRSFSLLGWTLRNFTWITHFSFPLSFFAPSPQLPIENIRRCPAPNDHPAFIDGLVETIVDHIASKETVSRQLMVQCPLCQKDVCAKTRQWLKTLP